MKRHLRALVSRYWPPVRRWWLLLVTPRGVRRRLNHYERSSPGQRRGPNLVPREELRPTGGSWWRRDEGKVVFDVKEKR